VFLGKTLIEREQKYGYWELMLTMAWPERNVTFRNLGWSGDTVWGESRAGFGTPADGFQALVEQVNAAQPTVIFVGYGNVEAFDGEAGLPRFVEGFNKLLDELEKTKARIAILAPLRPDDAKVFPGNFDEYRMSVNKYAAKLAELAAQREYLFVDWQRPRARNYGTDQQQFDTDGIQLTEGGYVSSAGTLGDSLGLSSPYIVDGAIRSNIIKKNELFFHRWRPQNETYLFGFRKHEQGNNAREVFEFDPLVAAEEKKIAEFRTKLAAESKEVGDAK
jgi:hypothetical protein